MIRAPLKPPELYTASTHLQRAPCLFAAGEMYDCSSVCVFIMLSCCCRLLFPFSLTALLPTVRPYHFVLKTLATWGSWHGWWPLQPAPTQATAAFPRPRVKPSSARGPRQALRRCAHKGAAPSHFFASSFEAVLDLQQSFIPLSSCSSGCQHSASSDHSKPEARTAMVLLNGLILCISLGLPCFCVLCNDYKVVNVVGIRQLKYPCPTEAAGEVRRQHRL